jgi:hypothetical protein
MGVVRYTPSREGLARGGDDFANIAGTSFPLTFDFLRKPSIRGLIKRSIKK